MISMMWSEHNKTYGIRYVAMMNPCLMISFTLKSERKFNYFDVRPKYLLEACVLRNRTNTLFSIV